MSNHWGRPRRGAEEIEYNRIIGDFLHGQRQELGVGHEEMQLALGYATPGGLWQVERARSLTMYRFQRFCNALGITMVEGIIRLTAYAAERGRPLDDIPGRRVPSLAAPEWEREGQLKGHRPQNSALISKD